MFNKLFAVCLLVEDFQRSVKFYTDVLGLEINNTDANFVDFKLGETALAIFQKDAADAMFPLKYQGTTGGLVLAFQVDDIAEFVEILQSKCVEIFDGPKTTAWGQTVAYFKDPDGNIWEVSNK